MTRNEKQLYLTLWLLIAVSVCLWIHWPRKPKAPITPPATITISDELSRFFSKARLKDTHPDFYLIEFDVQKPYRAEITEPKTIHIGYEVMGERGLLGKGAVPITLDGTSALVTMRLENRNRMALDRIGLYLAH